MTRGYPSSSAAAHAIIAEIMEGTASIPGGLFLKEEKEKPGKWRRVGDDEIMEIVAGTVTEEAPEFWRRKDDEEEEEEEEAEECAGDEG
eukprot:CAMPEP_0113581780 /NCGR_PEP_ID=MMETSP0015_2-20120614/31509_1 /TAXON_ID=2838 /ORGANISM="Odontella" /LENGTH=88 /DNA_ID=CAMNT_0000486299 /DNA_START=19 /DNA_END=281 /DNA_ORIENTATION=+ /assembly_acc=CAM_ASM_000160